MRTYGERFLNRKIKAEVAGKSETRDAIIMDIDPTSSTCRVKIQGSNEYIIAYFSELRTLSPAWLKPGAAVRIAHKGGIRGYVDVVGAGQTVPTGFDTKPEQSTPTPDAILSGCTIQLPKIRRDAFGSNKGILWVTTGTYRVGNVVKTIPALKMTRDLKMLNQPIVGLIAAQVILTKPDKGKYLTGRVLLNKLTGQVSCPTQMGSNPMTPPCPEGYLDAGCFLYSYTDAEFNESCLNLEYQKPVPVYFSATGAVVLDYETIKTPIVVEVKDQYGGNIVSPAGWTVTAKLSNGSGYLSLDGVSTSKNIEALINTEQFTFYYHRDRAVQEKSPNIKIIVSGIVGSQDYDLFLLDAAGQSLGGM